MIRNSYKVDQNIPNALIHRGPAAEGEHPLSVLDKGINQELVDALLKRGVYPFITRGLGAFTVEKVVAFDPKDKDNSTPQPKELGLSDVGVIRDIAGSFKEVTDVTEPILKATRVINGPRVRRGDNKIFAAESGMYGDKQIPTVAIKVGGSAGDIRKLIADNFEGQNLVFAKPAEGYGSKGLYRIDLTNRLAETIAEIANETTKRDYVLQSFIDCTLPLPSTIKPENSEQAALIERFYKAPKELRIFWFYSKDRDLAWFPVVKLTELMKSSELKLQSKRHYAFIDPDTVPIELIYFTQRVLSDFATDCDVTEMSGALDFAYGKVNNETEARWYVMEGNYWQPVPPSKKEHPALRKKFEELTADLLAQIAITKKME